MYASSWCSRMYTFFFDAFEMYSPCFINISEEYSFFFFHECVGLCCVIVCVQELCSVRPVFYLFRKKNPQHLYRSIWGVIRSDEGAVDRSGWQFEFYVHVCIDLYNTYTCIYASTYKYIYIYVYIYAYVHEYRYICIYTYIYMYVYICMYMYVYIYICLCIYQGNGWRYRNSYVCMQLGTAHVSTCMYIYIYMYTYTQI